MSINISSPDITPSGSDSSNTTVESDVAVNSQKLLYRSLHHAMPEEQLKQLRLRDEVFGTRLLEEILSRLEKGFADYSIGHIEGEEETAAIDRQNNLAAYERLINRFNDVVYTFSSYRIAFGFMERIAKVIFPLVCCPVLAKRTTSLWITLAARFSSVLGTKKKSDVPTFALDWKPLCRLVLELIGEPCLQTECPSAGRDALLFSKNNLNSLVEACCRYFDENAMEEIWSFLKPRFQRRNCEFYLGLLCGLLPVHQCVNTPRQREVAANILDTLFSWSEGRFNVLAGFGFQTCDIFLYMASDTNVGKFDFTDYAERIFTLNLRMSGLRSDYATTTHGGFPVPQFQVGVGAAAFFSPEKLADFKNLSIASGIAFALPNDTRNVLWSHLKRFLRACETYTCSSSASTGQSRAVATWVYRFVTCFVDRVRDQRLQVFGNIPPSHALSQETIDYFTSLLQRHVVERLYRTVGNATELMCLVALSPQMIIPSVQKLVAQGAASGSQTSFPQVALSIVGQIANQAAYLDDATKLGAKAIVLTHKDWVLESLEDTNGPNFIAACGALAGMCCLLPLWHVYEDETAVVMRITKALFKLASAGVRDDRASSMSILLMFLYRACNPEALHAAATYVVEDELKTKATTVFAERVFLAALSAYIPDKVIDLYFPVVESILSNPRSTLLEKKAHMELFATLNPGSLECAVRYAPRLVTCIKHLLCFITSADLVILSGKMMHFITYALTLPRPIATPNHAEEIDASTGTIRVIEGKDSKVEWVMPTAASKLLAVVIYADLTLWTSNLLVDLGAAVVTLKLARDALAIPLYDHEEAYSLASVRRGLTRLMQLCVGDIGRQLVTASTAYKYLQHRVADIEADAGAVVDSMLSAVNSNSYVYASIVPGVFDASNGEDAESHEKSIALLSKVNTQFLLDVCLKAAAQSEETDDAVSTQNALTAIHMLHGISFSTGKTLRDIIESFRGDPAGFSKKRSFIYLGNACAATAADVSAYMSRDDMSKEERIAFINTVAGFTNSPYVKVAKEAQDILLLHVRQMRLEDCMPFIEAQCRKIAEFISSPNDITTNTIAEKNFINAMIVASSLCTSATPSAIRIFLSPFIEGTVQLRCRPSVETSLERVIAEVLGKLSRSAKTDASDWLLDAIFKVMNNSFQMTPQKKVMFLDQLGVLRLRRTDDRFVKRLMNLTMELMPLFHGRDLSLVVAAKTALSGITHSLFEPYLMKRVELANSSSSDKNNRDTKNNKKNFITAPMKSPVVVEVESDREVYKKKFIESTCLRTMGIVNLADAFEVYGPTKRITVSLATAAGTTPPTSGSNAADDQPSSSSSSTIAREHPHIWSATRWRDWFADVLKRLSVGDCGHSFRTLIMFTSRMAMLSNFAIVPAMLEACKMAVAEYRSVTDTNRRRESGAAVCAFAFCRTVEEAMRAELVRIDHRGGGWTLSYRDGEVPADFASFLKENMELSYSVVEDIMLVACEDSAMTTETFFEFVSITPLESDHLRSRLIAKISGRVLGVEFVVTEGAYGGAPSSVSEVPVAVTSPLFAKSPKSIYRYFCFLVALSAATAYESCTVLDPNAVALTILRRHFDAILLEASQASSIAQQLIDQIGHFIARNLHFSLMWASDEWSFTRGLVDTTEGFLKALLEKSVAMMNTYPNDSKMPANNSSSPQPHTGVMSPVPQGHVGGDSGNSPPEEDISIRSGDTCKFLVLLMIRILSLAYTQFVEDLFPAIITWLATAQRWVKDDTAIGDRITSLSRNIVSRDISKACAQGVVSRLCDLLLEVANESKHMKKRAAGAAAGKKAGVHEDDGYDTDDSESDENDNAHNHGEDGGAAGLLSPNGFLTEDTKADTPPPTMLSPADEQPVPPAKLPASTTAATVSSSMLSPAEIQQAVQLKKNAEAALIGGSISHNGNPKRTALMSVSAANTTATVRLSSARRLVLMLTAMLSRTLFLNLHRIGKFVMLQRCAEAMSASLGSLSHTAKSDHKVVAKNAIAVLVRVSSDEQIAALINPHLDVLKQATATEGGLGAIARSDPAQLKLVKKAIHFLCAIVLAYPEQVPPFCGKILKALAHFGTAPVAEVKNAVTFMFKVWWRSHRERWEYEFKDQFTPAQQSVVLEYWSSSSYYA